MRRTIDPPLNHLSRRMILFLKTPTGARQEPDSRCGEQKLDSQHARQRVPVHRLDYVGIHRLPRSSGIASNDRMVA